jgi:hypothetical protein
MLHFLESRLMAIGLGKNIQLLQKFRETLKQQNIQLLQKFRETLKQHADLSIFFKF